MRFQKSQSKPKPYLELGLGLGLSMDKVQNEKCDERWRWQFFQIYGQISIFDFSNCQVDHYKNVKAWLWEFAAKKFEAKVNFILSHFHLKIIFSQTIYRSPMKISRIDDPKTSYYHGEYWGPGP